MVTNQNPTAAIWTLVDAKGSLEGEGEYPVQEIRSSSELRDALQSLSRSEPRVLWLLSPAGPVLGLALGVGFGAAYWYPGRWTGRSKVAVNRNPFVSKPMYFVRATQPSTFAAERIFSAEEVIVLAVTFFEAGELAGFAEWR